MSDTQWYRSTDRRLNALETRTAVDEVHRAMVEKRLQAIEDVLKWLVRLVVGAVIMGIIAYALNGGITLSGAP